MPSRCRSMVSWLPRRHGSRARVAPYGWRRIPPAGGRRRFRCREKVPGITRCLGALRCVRTRASIRSQDDDFLAVSTICPRRRPRDPRAAIPRRGPSVRRQETAPQLAGAVESLPRRPRPHAAGAVASLPRPADAGRRASLRPPRRSGVAESFVGAHRATIRLRGVRTSTPRMAPRCKHRAQRPRRCPDPFVAPGRRRSHRPLEAEQRVAAPPARSITRCSRRRRLGHRAARYRNDPHAARRDPCLPRYPVVCRAARGSRSAAPARWLQSLRMAPHLLRGPPGPCVP